VIYDFASIALPGLLFTGSATLGDNAINPANGDTPAKMGWIDGNPGQVLIQCEGVLCTLVYCAVATFIILKVIDVVIGLRVDVETERDGLDLALHGETVQ